VTSDVIPDRATAYGERVRRRLTEETTVWLTTVGRDGPPQPYPVGFLWDGGDSLLIYGQVKARRLANIQRSRGSRSTSTATVASGYTGEFWDLGSGPYFVTDTAPFWPVMAPGR
jgi:hypothetical protein